MQGDLWTRFGMRHDLVDAPYPPQGVLKVLPLWDPGGTQTNSEHRYYNMDCYLWGFL